MCSRVVTLPPCAAVGTTCEPRGDASPCGVLTGAIGGSAIAFEGALLCCMWFAEALGSASGCRAAPLSGAELARPAPPGRILAAMGATCNQSVARHKVRSSCKERGCGIMASSPLHI